MRTRFLVVAVVGLALAGCLGSSTPEPAVPSVGTLTAKLKAEGDALMAQKAYDQAVVKYQTALNQAPNDIPLHFALAVALSHLPRREETVENFRIVMTRGTPGSHEVKIAREWLMNAGELEGYETATAAPTTTEATDKVKKGKVFGKIRWQDIEPHTRMVHIRITLTGDDVETRDVKLGREFMMGRVYEFRDVPAGSYRLVAEVGGTTMWGMTVAVPAQQETVIDLTDSNAAVPKDFSPSE
jgi:hypothetical protein